MKPAVFVYLITLLTQFAQAQSAPRRYAIEVAGLRVGTMTVTRDRQGDRELYTTISDVNVNLLLYTVKIYYKTTSEFQKGQLLHSVVEARTNRGNYSSRTDWKGDQYVIEAHQYKHDRKATEKDRIDFTVTSMFFEEPTGRTRVYGEYFGDYFALTRTPKGTYRATYQDREDEYVYEQGRLVKVIKKNALKNFVIKPVSEP